MRTNVVLDDALVQEAIAVTGIQTRRELLDTALRELIRAYKKKSLFDLTGKIHYEADFDYKKLREVRDVAGR